MSAAGSGSMSNMQLHVAHLLPPQPSSAAAVGVAAQASTLALPVNRTPNVIGHGREGDVGAPAMKAAANVDVITAKHQASKPCLVAPAHDVSVSPKLHKSRALFERYAAASGLYAYRGAVPYQKFECPVCSGILQGIQVYKTHVKRLRDDCIKAHATGPAFDYATVHKRRCKLSTLVAKHSRLLGVPESATAAEFQAAALKYSSDLHEWISERSNITQAFDNPNAVWSYRE